MGAWTSGQSECTDITGYNGMNVWSVFCITQWGGALEPCSDQIKLFEPPGSPAYLLYTEDASKNNPGGLKHRKIAPNK